MTKKILIYGSIITIITIITSSIFYIRNRILDRVERDKEYTEWAYPSDTTINGKIISIRSIQVKRFGDLLYSSSNRVTVESDTTFFSFTTDEINYNINDSIIIQIDKNRKSIIINKYGNKSIVLYDVINDNRKIDGKVIFTN
ncbi:MAG: hypothetical protein KDH96_11955 [Candidatus Riesia sp.]|nr:hypothetical protein [Candidatus Riesia sp.]